VARHLGTPRCRRILRPFRADHAQGVQAGHRRQPDGAGVWGDGSPTTLKSEGRGALIHISSLKARRATPLHSAYAAAFKHGIDGFLEALTPGAHTR
jgi:NAD(P)-dependent dehydrogenase (short-subunit alcohol dehydrogenase family)